ncbi:MAG: DUF3649 domain-containing protein [Proteobacteria bacterium]|nr:MAG: DUF3649 domain-containing protein [Pseudomonadota bacterium]
MWAPRWLGILSRTIAAIAGGYLLASLSAVGCAVWMGPPRSEAVLTGMLLSYAVYAGAVIWVFAARSAWSAWTGLIVPSAVLGGSLFLTGAIP